jgi:hypothetical protein
VTDAASALRYALTSHPQTIPLAVDLIVLSGVLLELVGYVGHHLT